MLSCGQLEQDTASAGRNDIPIEGRGARCHPRIRQDELEAQRLLQQIPMDSVSDDENLADERLALLHSIHCPCDEFRSSLLL